MIALGWTGAAFAADASSLMTWSTVVNNNDRIPGVEQNFNSYNQPSVNANGLVVFRARSKGEDAFGKPTHGIYTRDMALPGSSIVRILDQSALVPSPNNLDSTYLETPAFPRIDKWSSTIVTRGNHQPVYEYAIDEATDTRVGTTGIYSNPYGELLTGAGKLATAPGYEYFAVPGIEPSLPFESFPGAPSVTDGSIIVFKGNYTVDGFGKTGVYFRELEDGATGGTTPAVLIANSTTTIIPGSDPAQVFGSVAPPSAADGKAVFAGYDNEETPSLGGLYLAPLVSEPQLTTIVGIGSQVPGEPSGATFTHFGEGLAYDGRYVGFWGAWGTETKTVRLYCPTEGNKDRIAYCNNTGDFADGKGDPNSICNDTSDDTDRCYQEKIVPVHQGIFVSDSQTGQTVAVAKTGSESDEFLFWNYSGKVPGTEGEDDGEPARWRSSPFVAVSGTGNRSFNAAFKERKGDVDGIYLLIGANQILLTVLDTTMAGQAIDPEAPVGSVVTEIGMEREGLRGPWLVVNATMGIEGGTEEEGLAGIYLAEVPTAIDGDLDLDDNVDTADLYILKCALRTSTGQPGYIPAADYDNDGDIDFSDYQKWYGYYKAFISK